MLMKTVFSAVTATKRLQLATSSSLSLRDPRHFRRSDSFRCNGRIPVIETANWQTRM